MKIFASFRKFDWPNHLWMAMFLLAERMATALGTARARAELRLHGVRQIGAGLCVKGRLHLYTRRNDSIRLGKQVSLVSRFKSNLAGLAQPCLFDTLAGGRIDIGDHVGMSGVVLSSRTSITIGHRVKLGANVRVFDHDFHSLDPAIRRSPDLDQANVRSRPVRLGDDVFVGANAMILKGTNVGARSIIGAGAVVAGLQIPEDSLVTGNPARIIRQRRNVES